MVRVTVGCSTACGALEPPVSPVSSAQAAWGGQPHAEDERHEQRDRFLRVRFCTQTRGIGLALPQKTDSEGLPQITIRWGCFAAQ